MKCGELSGGESFSIASILLEDEPCLEQSFDKLSVSASPRGRMYSSQSPSRDSHTPLQEHDCSFHGTRDQDAEMLAFVAPHCIYYFASDPPLGNESECSLLSAVLVVMHTHNRLYPQSDKSRKESCLVLASIAPLDLTRDALPDADESIHAASTARPCQDGRRGTNFLPLVYAASHFFSMSGSGAGIC